ncbi:MAG: hypothetical protein PHI97_15885 [Desulfobulbus sp.]|nr:hypothetical protein [Desulfobulbus sp.]
MDLERGGTVLFQPVFVHGASRLTKHYLPFTRKGAGTMLPIQVEAGIKKPCQNWQGKKNGR